MGTWSGLFYGAILLIGLTVAVVHIGSKEREAELQNRVSTPMIGGSLTYRRGGPWPECVYESVDDCVTLIKASSLRNNHDIDIIYPQDESTMTHDFQPNRVRVYVDEDGIVYKIPKLG